MLAALDVQLHADDDQFLDNELASSVFTEADEWMYSVWLLLSHPLLWVFQLRSGSCMYRLLSRLLGAALTGKPITLPVPMTPALPSIGKALFGLKPRCYDAMLHLSTNDFGRRHAA